MVTVGVLAIGNELLLGIVQDTNTSWLCRQITGRGGRVERAAVIRDEIEAIVEALQDELSKKRDLIITSGGLGPTQDDLTLQAVAIALGRELVLNEEAYQMVEERYRKLAEAGRIASGGMTDERRKMALLPRGAIPLENDVGTAPGVLIRADKAMIASLPGVPAELKGIFQRSLQPYLKELFGEGFHAERELVVATADESLLAPLLRELSTRFPQVYIKSHAKGFGKGSITITLAMSGPQAEIERALNSVESELREELEAKGIPLGQG